MRVTEVAERPPRTCAVTNREVGPFVDFQTQIDPPTTLPVNLYLHAAIVEEAARLLGMVPAKEVETLRTGMERLSAELDDLKSTADATSELAMHLDREKERV